MVWHSTAPDGGVSVATNRPTLQDNTTYTETTLNVDHFWNIGTNEDGRHQFVQSPSYGSDPTLGTGMDQVFYANTVGADVQPVVQNDTYVMPLAAIRASGVFSVSGGTVTEVLYHNISGISRTATGNFTASFDTNLPSNEYFVFGGAIYNGAGNKILNFNIQGTTNASLNNVKTTSQIMFRTTDETNTRADPIQCWFVCFGG